MNITLSVNRDLNADDILQLYKLINGVQPKSQNY